MTKTLKYLTLASVLTALVFGNLTWAQVSSPAPTSEQQKETVTSNGQTANKYYRDKIGGQWRERTEFDPAKRTWKTKKFVPPPPEPTPSPNGGKEEPAGPAGGAGGGEGGHSLITSEFQRGERTYIIPYKKGFEAPTYPVTVSGLTPGEPTSVTVQVIASNQGGEPVAVGKAPATLIGDQKGNAPVSIEIVWPKEIDPNVIANFQVEIDENGEPLLISLRGGDEEVEAIKLPDYVIARKMKLAGQIRGYTDGIVTILKIMVENLQEELRRLEESPTAIQPQIAKVEKLKNKLVFLYLAVEVLGRWMAKELAACRWPTGNVPEEIFNDITLFGLGSGAIKDLLKKLNILSALDTLGQGLKAALLTKNPLLSAAQTTAALLKFGNSVTAKAKGLMGP